MGLCGWIVFGLVVGLIARAIMPGRQGMGLVATTLLGIGGSFMGGFIASVLWGGNWHVLRPSGFIGALVGSLVLLLLGQMMSGRR